MVLIFLVERIEENSITNEYLDQELSGADVQASILIKVRSPIQVVVNIEQR